MTIHERLEHTLLKPEAVPAEIEQLCKEAKEWQMAGVCVNSAYVPLAAALCRGSGVRVVTVVGFPLGAMASEAKAFETDYAVRHGADEIDMVLAIGAAKTDDWDYVREDIRKVVEAAKGRPVKVILETGLLTEEEKRRACQIAAEAGAAYVKTSTGFGHGGAAESDILLMKEAVQGRCLVKASGGIRDLAAAKAMVAAGADRIGTSCGAAIAAAEAK